MRAQRYAEVTRLRERGWTYPEIAYLTDLSLGYVKSLLNDPDGSKAKARKQSYGGTCEVCGERTDGSNGRDAAPKMCDPCAQKQKYNDRYWTRERVLAGMRRLAKDVAPRRPIATDILKEIPKDEDGQTIYPPYGVIRRELGSWANAIEEIGFERPRSGVRTPEGEARRVASLRGRARR